jgi:hypothetical protein
MELLFFFKVEAGAELFITTELLSQYTYDGPAIGIPIIRSLYLRPHNISAAIFNATNSEPKVLVSTVFCFLLYHTTGKLVPSVVRLHKTADFYQFLSWHGRVGGYVLNQIFIKLVPSVLPELIVVCL